MPYLIHYGVKGMTWDIKKNKTQDAEKQARETIEKYTYSTPRRSGINRVALAKSEAKAAALAKKSAESTSEFEKLINQAPEPPEGYVADLEPSTFGKDLGYIDKDGIFYVGNKKQATTRYWKRNFAIIESRLQTQRIKDHPVKATIEKGKVFITNLLNKLKNN